MEGLAELTSKELVEEVIGCVELQPFKDSPLDSEGAKELDKASHNQSPKGKIYYHNKQLSSQFSCM